MLLLGLVSVSCLSITFNLYTGNHNIYVFTDYFVLIFRGGIVNWTTDVCVYSPAQYYNDWMVWFPNETFYMIRSGKQINKQK